jgi:hypothetical protein
MIILSHKPKAYQATVSRENATRLAARCLDSGSLQSSADILERASRRIGNTTTRGTWGYYAKRFAAALRDENRREAFRIFQSNGNTKLPFVAFSTLPLFTCPGAGDCATYCYSLRAWRYPAAYYRQLQNTLLLRFAPDRIAKAFRRIRPGRTLRLYVDGDIENTTQLQFWFDLLQERPDIRACGYSKSWEVFAEHDVLNGQYPDNYALNLSSGSRYGAELLSRMRQLPITRGEFIAVRTTGEHPRDTAERFASKAYHADVRTAARQLTGNPRVFSCTGKCGTCAKSSHACGDRERFHLVTIAIGIH